MPKSLLNYDINYHTNGIKIDIDSKHIQDHQICLYPPYTYNISNHTKYRYYDQEFLLKENIGYTMQNSPLIVIPEDTLPDATDTNTMYEYSVNSFLAESIYGYMIILDICLSNNIEHVIDIGCASGIQSIIFNENGISYVGVDSCLDNCYYPYALLTDLNKNCAKEFKNSILSDLSLSNVYFNKDTYYFNSRYCYNRYPDMFFNTYDKSYYDYDIKNTALISHHCIFYVVDESINKQILPMSYFKHVILNMPLSVDLDSNRRIKHKYNVQCCYEDEYGKFLYLSRKKESD